MQDGSDSRRGRRGEAPRALLQDSRVSRRGEAPRARSKKVVGAKYHEPFSKTVVGAKYHEPFCNIVELAAGAVGAKHREPEVIQ